MINGISPLKPCVIAFWSPDEALNAAVAKRVSDRGTFPLVVTCVGVGQPDAWTRIVHGDGGKHPTAIRLAQAGVEAAIIEQCDAVFVVAAAPHRQVCLDQVHAAMRKVGHHLDIEAIEV